MTLPDLAWLVPVGPFAAFALIALGAHRSKALSQGLSILGILAALVLSQLVFWGVVGNPTAHSLSLLPWYTLGTERALVSTSIDSTDAIMVAMVSFVCLMIFVYSIGYMEADRHSSRFFAYVSLFAGAMLGAIVCGNLLVLFIFWEIMGVCSYLLIGFWWERPSASRAAFKAFLVTKVGDIFMLLGLALLYAQVGSLSYASVFDPNTVSRLAATPYIGTLSVASVAVLLLFGGTVGKSAQFPLHVWLPDAMEGPTPASALIHAATMVSAGVYLMLRAYPLVVVSQVMPVIAVVGVVTALYAAIVAVAQNDIKRVLAFSTISQLGYMVAAIGIGAYTASLFHLITHAFFKALLFMAAGSVIHGMEHGHHHTRGHAVPAHVADEAFDPQDMWKMGGLAFRMPFTAVTFLAGGLALSGFPLITAGFWSKDEILAKAWGGNPAVFWGLAIAAAVTAFYSGRQLGLAFLGAPRSRAAVYARENKAVMVVPMVLLAMFAIGLGWTGIPSDFPVLGRLVPNWFGDFVAKSLTGISGALGGSESEGLGSVIAWQPLVLGMVAALGGLASGWWVYGRNLASEGEAEDADPLRQALGRLRLGWLYQAMAQRFYIDAFYDAVVVGPSVALSAFLSWFDRRIIDGSVVALGRGFGQSGRIAPVADKIDEAYLDRLTDGAGIVSGIFARIAVAVDGSVIDGLVHGVASAFGALGRWVRRMQTGLLPDYLWNAFMIILLLVAVLVMFRRL